MVKKAILRSFDSIDYTATVQIVGSLASWLEDVPFSRAIPSAELQPGRTVAVLFFSPTNPSDALIVAVH